jgi:hypothetical protein
LVGPLWGEVLLFCVVLRLRRTKKISSLAKKKSFMTTLYLLKIVFPKFNPLTVTGMALFVELGQKCPNLFCLV